MGEHLTFKGGASFSKAYGIIDRFSEDIDLTIGRTAPQIGLINSPLEVGISRNERDRRTKALKAAGRDYNNEAMPALEVAIARALAAGSPVTANGVVFTIPPVLHRTPLKRGQSGDNTGYFSSFRRQSDAQGSCFTNSQATSCLKISLNQREDRPDLLM